ncbi:hypothetical protein HmCms148_02483 [Escherichia coli]|nr:hypothetical protein HmCms148_02483 [Escherichia coli]
MTDKADNPQQLSPGKEKLHACTENTAGKVLYGCQGINAHHRNVPAEVMTARKRKLTAVCSHQTRIGNLDAHLI